MELFFAKFFGLYFLIVGAVMLIRRRSVMPAISELAKNRALILVLSVLEIAGGIGLILVYPRVSVGLEGLISLIGYILIIEGVFYLGAPTKVIKNLIGSFNKPVWFVLGGLLSVTLGIYLAKLGFGLV